MSPSLLPPSLLDAFALAAGELGMFSAARLFCEQMSKEGDATLVRALRDLVGPSYPVLDAVARAFERDAAVPAPNHVALFDELAGVRRVVVVGAEAVLVDALIEQLPIATPIGVVIDGVLPASVARVDANLDGRASLLSLEDVVHWSGVHTALVTSLYGSDGFRAVVCGAWLRLMGPDTRASFGSIVGFNLLGPMMQAYPRYLTETTVADFTALVSA